jgi:hypothetical protein
LPPLHRLSRRRVLRWLGLAAGLALAGCRGLALPTKTLIPKETPTVDTSNKQILYVAPNGDDAWSGSLPKPNANKTDGPLATLNRAKAMVREWVKAGLTQDVVVMIRQGTYYLGDGLFFGPEEGGTAEHSVTYMSYPGEEATLVGGRRLTAWTQRPDGSYEADLAGDRPNQLFENGQRMTAARLPKTGYFRVKEPVSSLNWAFKYDPKDLVLQDWDLTDARISIWPQYNWFNWTRLLLNAKPEEQTIILAPGEGYKITAGNRYFIENVINLLTEPGECQISPTKGKIYCRPRKTPIQDQELVIATARNLIRLQGQAGSQPVRNLHFVGLNLSIAAGDVVQVNAAEDCSVRYCKIENGGENGVAILGHSRRITIYGNLIKEHGYCGVLMEGLAWGQPDVNGEHLVENNHIHHCGRLVGHGAGVYIEQSGHNKVLHNHIHHTPRYGTTIKGIHIHALKEILPKATWEERYQYVHSNGNLIAYNDIHHANLDSQDTGAMESWGCGRDNVYDHNLVHDSGNTEFDLQSGMYLDDATDWMTVTNNIIWGIVGTTRNQCIFTKGLGNKFHNNILIVSPACSSGIASFFMADLPCKDHDYSRNIIYIEARDAGAYNFMNWADDRVAISDYNVFYNPKGEVRILGGPGNGPLSQWRALQNKKYDQHSVEADPLFVDPEHHNYHLRPDSPALKLGFVDIDTSTIGLKDDFPPRFERE